MARTRLAYIWTHVLNTPFWAIFNMLPFILYKDLEASMFQITVAVTLKPLVSLLSVYWSSLVNQRRDRLKSNVIWARILGHLPFFFFPFVDNVWFFIASFGFYMMLARGVVPAWMEILKLNIPHLGREKVVAWAGVIGYVGNALFPFLIGWALDEYVESWRWLFPITALISLCATILKMRIPIRLEASPVTVKNKQRVIDCLIAPWKQAWNLIQRRPDFLKFQMGFMLGGAGVMIMQPALPAYFVDYLQLSYTELAVALTLCKAIGFALTSPTWSRWMHKADIYRLCAIPPLCICAFSLCLAAAGIHWSFLYLAYVFYGVMQAGSEIGWHLSGPLFAGNEDSSPYSNVNVLSVGVRGSVVPPLGSLIASLTSPLLVIMLGGGICAFAYRYFNVCSEEHRAEELV